MKKAITILFLVFLFCGCSSRPNRLDYSECPIEIREKVFSGGVKAGCECMAFQLQVENITHEGRTISQMSKLCQEGLKG